ncbi:hypothetical protein ACWC96_27170, partial [Streptomyces eurythermus]
AYMIQWWLFAAAVPVGWWFLVRRELRDRSRGPSTGAAPRDGPRARCAQRASTGTKSRSTTPV